MDSAASERARAHAQEFWSRFVQPRVAHIRSLSSLGSTNLVRDARQTLNDELAAMHAAMCTLRTHLNALSPISSLPAEVLVYIFKLVSEAMRPEFEFQNQRSGPGFGWIREMTHVCRHWRETALLHPSLWSEVNHRLTPRWRKLMISRAKSLPLILDLQSCDPEENTLLAEHAFHTRVLRLSAPAGVLKRTCEAFTSSADILERLELCASGPYPLSSASIVVLNTDIFAGQTPSLRSITLNGVFPSWSAPIFRNLTHLQVSIPTTYAILGSLYIQPDETNPISQYDHLLNALAGMSALETLELARCIPPRPIHAAVRLAISLPCLELISLVDTSKGCGDVIQHLIVPASSRVALIGTVDPHPIDDLVHFFDRHANGRDMPPLLILFIYHTAVDDSGWFEVDLWRTCGPSAFSEACMGCRPTEEPFISVQLPPSSDPLDDLKRLLSVLPLEDLRTLKIESDSDIVWPAETWINIFGRCTRVEHLSVQGSNGMQLYKALTLPAEGTVSADDGSLSAGRHLFFRRLKSLEVCAADLLCDLEGSGRPCVSSLKSQLILRENILNAGLGGSEGFRENNSDEIGMDEDVDNDGNYSGVAKDGQDTNQDHSMPRRDVVGHIDNRLERLWITDCSVMAEHVEQLMPVVQDLVWDRCEGIWEDASENEHNYNI